MNTSETAATPQPLNWTPSATTFFYKISVAVSWLWLINSSSRTHLHIFSLQDPICWSAWPPASVCISTGTRRRCAVCPAGEATSSRAWAGTSCWAMRPTQGPSWLAPAWVSSLKQRSLQLRAACSTPIQISTSDRCDHSLGTWYTCFSTCIKFQHKVGYVYTYCVNYQRFVHTTVIKNHRKNCLSLGK